MKVLVDKYMILIKIYVAEYKVHMAAIFFKLVQLPFQMFMYLFLWAFIAKTSNVDYDYMILYYLLTGMLSLAYPFLHISIDIQNDVMEGGIANSLVRPYNYIMPYLCKYIAWMYIYSIIYIPVLIGLFVFGKVNFLSIIFFIFSSVIGMFIEFMIWFSLGLLSLYFEKIRGFIRIIGAIKMIVSGSLIPLYIMPETLQKLTMIFPFRYYIYIPVNNLLNNVSSFVSFENLIAALIWLILLSMFALLLWTEGKKRMQVNVS